MKKNEHRCKLCNKKLKTWQSVLKGLGPECEKKYLEELEKKQLKMEDLKDV